jgi:hypothetical protein
MIRGVFVSSARAQLASECGADQKQATAAWKSLCCRDGPSDNRSRLRNTPNRFASKPAPTVFPDTL